MRLMNSARDRARDQEAEFSITVEDVRAVFPADGLCPVLRTPMTQGKGRAHDGSPTLDRVNPDWGYVAGNIAVISMSANRAKGAMRADELQRVVDWMRGKGLA